MEFLKEGFSLDAKTTEILVNMIFGTIAGALISISYAFAHKEKNYSKQFVITLLLLPIVMTVVIPLISTDLKKAVSLAGIFALVRFRSVPGDSKDILYVFFTLAVGIAIALNYYIAAFVLVILVSALFVILERKLSIHKEELLKITIPEDMNYNHVFDDIFEKYLKSFRLQEVRTTNMGTLFMISYKVTPKEGADIKAFIDEIRTRNGNLNVIVAEPDDEVTKL